MGKVVSRCALFALALMLGLGWAADSEAVEPAPNTVITVEEMCGGCVKKITAHFANVKQVAEVRCDIPSKTVTIIPAQGVTISPRWLWQTMDSIGKTPRRLAGPHGVFTSVPQI